MLDTILQAAQEVGGFDIDQARRDGMTRADVESYFSEDNFRAMFPGDDPTECSGYTLDACAAAVCRELGL
jgi:hypothetical protein